MCNASDIECIHLCAVNKNMNMKKIILCAAIFLSVSIFKNAQAQISFNVNIGSQPAWGPVGYDHVEYYYLPDIETYYYVPQQQFIYMSGGRWVFSSYLPSSHLNYDLDNSYKVVVNETKPYMHFDRDRVRYIHYIGNQGQVIIRNSNEPKYFVVKTHPNYKINDEHNYNKNNGNRNDRGRGNDRYNGKWKEKDKDKGKDHH